MSKTLLLADSGSTKAEWCLLQPRKKKILFTQGISPYFMNESAIIEMLQRELLPQLKKSSIDAVYYYGTGCSNPGNVKMIRKALQAVLPAGMIKVENDLLGAARALCGRQPGVASILGTGSNSCYFNGKRIVKNSPGLGFILGDEGSGAYIGRKVLQHVLYNTFEDELMEKFQARYQTNRLEILDHVYRKPFPNRYLATFALFVSENRGHYMIENILEDSFNDFFFNHLYKYKESWKYPLHFTGGVAYAFKDVLVSLCETYGLQPGRILKHPMEGLIEYHKADL
ncbi:MAG: BadF/BadG/BcrA/BcrD ATPase family protein [Lacibacter sp.]